MLDPRGGSGKTLHRILCLRCELSSGSLKLLWKLSGVPGVVDTLQLPPKSRGLLLHRGAETWRARPEVCPAARAAQLAVSSPGCSELCENPAGLISSSWISLLSWAVTPL